MPNEVTCGCGWKHRAHTFSEAINLWREHLDKNECQIYRNKGQQNLFKEKEEKMISRERYAGTAILRHSDFKEGQKIKITRFMEIRSQLRDRPIQATIFLEGYDDPLPLNTTNLDTLLDAFGDDELDWKGKECIVHLIPTKTPTGEAATGIRLDVPTQAKTAKKF